MNNDAFITLVVEIPGFFFRFFCLTFFGELSNQHLKSDAKMNLWIFYAFVAKLQANFTLIDQILRNIIHHFVVVFVLRAARTKDCSTPININMPEEIHIKRYLFHVNRLNMLKILVMPFNSILKHENDWMTGMRLRPLNPNRNPSRIISYNFIFCSFNHIIT